MGRKGSRFQVENMGLGPGRKEQRYVFGHCCGHLGCTEVLFKNTEKYLLFYGELSLLLGIHCAYTSLIKLSKQLPGL